MLEETDIRQNSPLTRRKTTQDIIKDLVISLVAYLRLGCKMPVDLNILYSCYGKFDTVIRKPEGN